MDVQHTPNMLKRCRHDDVATSTCSSGSESQQSPEGEGLQNQHFSGWDRSTFSTDSISSLPMYTEDLGRFSVYEQLNWDDTAGILPESICPDLPGKRTYICLLIHLLN
jgi:hypothetical protein